MCHFFVDAQAISTIDSLYYEIEEKQNAIINLKSELESIKNGIKKDERLIKLEEKRMKDAEKKKEKKKRDADIASARSKREENQKAIQLSPRHKIDSIVAFINRNILDNETSFDAKLKVNEYCSASLKSKKDDYHFNLLETKVELDTCYKLKGFLGGKSRINTFSIKCKSDKEECIIKNKKPHTNVDQTLPFLSKSTVNGLIEKLEAIEEMCIGYSN